MTQIACDIEALLDNTTGALVQLKKKLVPGPSSLIALGGLSAVTSVAGVGPDGSKDIPAASLNAALATVLQVAGLSPSGAGAITAANLRTALGLPFTVAGVAASGWSGDVAVASLITALVNGNLATSLAAAQTLSWVQAQTFTGAFDGQRVKVPAIDGLGGWVFMIWNATAGKLEPEGVQVLGSYPKQTGNTGTGAQGFPVALPTATFTGGPFWVGTEVEVITSISDTVNGDTAAPVNMSFGTFHVIGDTQATVRRKRFHRAIEIQAAAVQFCHSKLDNAYYSYSGDNSAPLAGTQNTATGQTWNLTLDVSTGWNNASSHTPTLEKHLILWHR